MTADPLMGTWRMISWENRTADGRISYPIGTDPLGYITYSADGYVFVAIMRPNRRKFSAGDLLRGTPKRKRTPLKRSSPIAERMSSAERRSFTTSNSACFPTGSVSTWVGVDQERLVEVRANRLTLSTRPTLFAGVQQTARLVSERA